MSFVYSNSDVFDIRSRPPIVFTWRPRSLEHADWPPDYQAVYAWRMEQLKLLRENPNRLAAAKAYYAKHPSEFIMHWMDTYDPRKPDHKWMPFVFFSKQADFITFLHELRQTGESGLCEKSRDMGISWEACAYSIWSWLFIPHDAIGWGSRKQELVDKIGDVSSIFEKLRSIVRRLPSIWLPEGLKPRDHLTFMKMVNPANGSTIVGETGDNIGRGGRTAMYFKDESAHYERPEKIEAALGDNTNVQIDISSVNGLGNPFHRRREAGIDWMPGAVIPKGYVRVFVMDWRDHPEKTQEWYDTRKAKYEREGMQHLFAQEVDRNYSAAVSNAIIPYEWIVHCVDAHLKIPYLNHPPIDNWRAGLDVADGGIDRNALSTAQGIIWRTCEEWGERDPGVTARRAMTVLRSHRGIKCQYDAIGIGASVKSEFNNMRDAIDLIEDYREKERQWSNLPIFVPWNAGASVLDPYDRVIANDDNSLTNRDMYANLKAQAWFAIRSRIYKTFKAVTEGAIYLEDELISLDSSMPLLHQLMKELAQSTSSPGGSLRTVVNKTPDGMKSPNLADSGIMMFFPVPDDYGQVLTGTIQ